MHANPQSESGAELGAKAALDSLAAAWLAGDADAYAALHSVDARYVAFDGTVMRGRGAIAAGHRPLFGGIMRGSRLVSEDLDITFPAPDLAIAVQRAGIVMSWQGARETASPKRLSSNTTVLRPRRDATAGEGWEVVAFQNTRYRPWAKTLMGRLMTRMARE